MKKYNCAYCKYWIEAPRSKNKIKTCPVTNKNISGETTIECEYFNPESFHCDANECRLSIIVCLNRRRNIKGFEEWNKCKKCRQFEKEMIGFVSKYWVEGKTTKNIKEFKKAIKRRTTKQKRVIKRR